MAFAHQRPGAAARLKGAQIRLGLALQPDHGKDLHLEPQFAGVHIGVIAADITLFF